MKHKVCFYNVQTSYLYTTSYSSSFLFREITLYLHVICPKNTLPTCGLKIDTLPT